MSFYSREWNKTMNERMHNILVVDDDPDILTILKDNLELDGYMVYTATLGNDALSLVDETTPDLVVLDLMLPDLDGIQVCRKIREKHDLPIVLLTARDGLSDKVLGLDSGADDYIVKPFDYLELAARIKACLRRSRLNQMPEDRLVIGSLHLFPDSRRVELNDRPLDLTKKEYDILYLLMQNAGKVMAREHIRGELWPGEQLYKWSRTIDVHIQHLRAKIEPKPEEPRYILTIPGVGYVIDEPENR